MFLATPGWAATLPPPATSTHCVVDRTTLDDLIACALGTIGNASASLTLLPSASITVQATSPPNDSVFHGSAASAAITYSFEVVGGNPGDFVPILIATTLITNGSSRSHGIGFAELQVHTSAAGDSFVAVCTDGTCGTSSTTFFGTLSTRARSGDAANSLTLFAQASADGGGLLTESANAFADPFLFVDPAFPGANLYSIVVSPGVGNAAASAVPEPAGATLVILALVALAVAHRRAGWTAVSLVAGRLANIASRSPAGKTRARASATQARA